MPTERSTPLVRKRRTLKPDWSEDEIELVSCPLTGSSRSLDDCRGCVHSEGVLRDSNGNFFVVCRVAQARPASQDWEHLCVADVMTGSPVCIRRDVDLSEVVALFVEQGFSGAPVVDEDGRPIGIVSRADVLMDDYERAEDEQSTAWLKGRPAPRTAQEIMTPRSTSISERAPVLDVVRIMSRQRIHRLPVVDDSGRVVGIVSTLDVIRSLDRAHPSD